MQLNKKKTKQEMEQEAHKIFNSLVKLPGIRYLFPQISGDYVVIEASDIYELILKSVKKRYARK